MAHIHILLQPTGFRWPHYLVDVSGTPFKSGIQIVEKGAVNMENSLTMPKA